MTGAAPSADPRPRIVRAGGELRVEGARCDRCGYLLAVDVGGCPSCGGSLRVAHFGPAGTVWAVTGVHVDVQDRPVPYRLAYVDLDGGPRILAHVADDAPLTAVGDRVTLTATTAAGDPRVGPAPSKPGAPRPAATSQAGEASAAAFADDLPPAPAAPSVAHYRRLREQMATPLPARYNIAAAACDRWIGQGRTAMIVPDGDGGVRRWTFEDVAAASSRLANALADRGIGRGDRVSVCLPQSFDCAVVNVAVARLGAVIVPVSTISGTDAVRHRVQDSAARILIASADTHAWLREDELAGQVQLIMTGDAVPAGTDAMDELVRDAAPNRAPADTSIDDPAILIYTSGTTGAPKGALHAHRVVPAHAEPMSLAHNLFGGDGAVFWSPADWAWAGGLIDCLYSTWLAGRPIVAWRTRGFDPDAVLDMFARCGVTNTFLPPTALKRMRDAGDLTRRARALALRSIMTGGERAGAELIESTEAAFGTTPNEVYGQTEVSMVLGNSCRWLPVVPGALGMPYPRVRVAVLDDSDRELPAGSTGEIALHRSTPAMFLGYWDASRGAPAHPGRDVGDPAPEWHRTGDLGQVDEHGYFWHRGRCDDVILSSGYRIGPAEVEDVLCMHPAVAAASVIGEPDELRGEIVSAIVELRPGQPASDELGDALRQLVRERLAAYEVPRRVRFVDVLPRTESGKVRRGELRRQVLEADAEG